ncbi:MAG: hypothetical protein V3V05_01045 [Pontiella sp.]
MAPANLSINVLPVPVKGPHVVFLIHGMGKYVNDDGMPNDWASDWITLLETEAGKYNYFQQPGKSLSELITWVPITYDVYFHHYWKYLAETLAELKPELATKFPDLATDLPTADTMTNQNLYTHWADPLLWFASEFHQLVVAFVHEHLLKNIKAVEDHYQNLGQGLQVQTSIIAHSLGTAVAHDALAMLPAVISDLHTTNPDTLIINNLHTIANVSRILELDALPVYADPVSVKRWEDPNRSYCNSFYHYHNEYDPFTWLRRFHADQVPVGGTQVQIKTLEGDIMGIHGMENYLANPRVHGPILNSFANYSDIVTAADIDTYEATATTIDHTNLPGTIQEIVSNEDHLDLDQSEALEKLKEMLKEYGSQLLKGVTNHA